MKTYRIIRESTYTPRRGCMTVAIEKCLSSDEAKTADTISKQSGVALERVRAHLRYWTKAGRLEERETK
jgi:hypothetical protein